jgi:peptide/nickel transport system substrate-binding protein
MLSNGFGLRRLVVALALAAATVSSPGCRETPRLDTAAYEGSETPQAGGTLVRRLEGDVKTLNPLLLTSAYEKAVVSYIFDPLVEIDQRLRVVPGLARSWSVSVDGKTFTFELDPRARFSDGSPVRPEDVIFTLGRIVDPKTQSPQLSGYFTGLNLEQTRVTGPRTVVVVFDEFRAGQLLAFNIPIVPEHVYSEGDFRADFAASATGSGPYRVAKVDTGQQVVLEKRDDYWGTAPWISRVVFRVIGEDEVAWRAIKQGQIDETRVTSDIYRLEGDDPEVLRTLEIYRFYPLGYNFIPWNVSDPVLSDARVRRALTHALDRKSIVEHVYTGTARIVSGPFTPEQPGYNPTVQPMPYDLDASRALLAEAGWRDTNGDGIVDREGRPLTIELLVSAGNAASRDQSQIFQRSLKQVGVDLKLTMVDSATLFDRVMKGNFQGTLLHWSLDLDPDLFGLFHSSQIPPAGMNIGRYTNADVDRLIEEARREVDDGRRMKIYQQLHERLAGDQPYTWTVQVSDKRAISRRVRNVKLAEGLGPFFWRPGPLDWWLARPPEAEGAAAPVR